MDGNTVESFSELDTAFERLKKQADAVKNSFAEALLPLLTDLFNALAMLSPEQLRMIITLAGVVVVVINLARAIKGVTDMASSLTSFFSATSSGATKVLIIITAIVGSLILILGLIALIKEGKNNFDSSLANLKETSTEMQNSIDNTQMNYRNVPRYARGTSFHPGGRAVVGEEGPELVDLPAGTRVYNARQTSRLLSGGETNNYYITIDAKSVKEFNDVVRIAQNQKSSIRQGTVRG